MATTATTIPVDSIDVDKEAKCTSPNDKDRQKSKDEEGLSTHYDVVICGTGLVQSLVAAACARAGKSVLHLDGSDYYGELDAVWTLPYVIQQQQQHQSVHREKRQEAAATESGASNNPDEEGVPGSDVSPTEVLDEKVVPLDASGGCVTLQFHSMECRSKVEDYYPLQVGMHVSTPYGLGTIKSFVAAASSSGDVSAHASSRRGSLAIQLDAAKGRRTTLYAGIVAAGSSSSTSDELTLETLQPSDVAVHKIIPLAALEAHDILESRSRSFALDVTPSLLYCGGKSIQALLDSQVSDYLEFKSLNGLLWYQSSPSSSSSSSSTSAPRLLTVPCSKADVFNSELLAPMEKRRLMKFLQLALDYAVMKEGEEAEDFNDATDTSDSDKPTQMSTATVQSLNERILNQGRSLPRPQNKVVATGDLQALQDCILRRMSFEAFLKAKANISDHLSSIVQYALSLILSEQHPSEGGANAVPSFSTPLGVGMECLCRHMASLGKFGTTAFIYPLYGSGELSQAFCRSAAVYGATYLLRRPARGIVLTKDQVTSVILSERGDPEGEGAGDAKRDANDGGSLTKRIRCDHIVLPQQAISGTAPAATRYVLRRISILRGKCIGSNDNPRPQQQQLVAFPPASVNEHHLYPIHALLLDEHVNVVPHVNSGCTLVHLTTIASSTSQIDDLLSSALQSLLHGTERGVKCQEIFHLSFSYALDADSASSTPPARGLHVIPRSHVGVGNEDSFQRAHDIFREICPNDAYMKVAQKVAEGAMFQRRDDDDDDAQRILDSAMENIGWKSATTESPVEEDVGVDKGSDKDEA